MSHESTTELQLAVEARQSPWIKTGAIVCAIALTGALLAGYFLLQRRHKQQALAAQQAAQAAKRGLPVEAQVFENEARLQNGNALVGGTVRNVSNARLDNLMVEIQLIPRSGEELKLQQVNLEPASLNPGEEGHYSLAVPSHQWSATRLVRLYSAARNTEIGFKSQVGERRPVETQPEGMRRVVVVPHSKSSGNDGFLNTPDKPIPIH